MADFRFRGLDVIGDWPTASKVKGAARPSTERYFTLLSDNRCIWANTQSEMRERINSLHLEGSL